MKEELDCVGLWSDSRDEKCRQATGISLSKFSMARAIQCAIPSQYPSLIGGGFAAEMCGRTKSGKHGDIDIFVFFFKTFNLEDSMIFAKMCTNLRETIESAIVGEDPSNWCICVKQAGSGTASAWKVSAQHKIKPPLYFEVDLVPMWFDVSLKPIPSHDLTPWKTAKLLTARFDLDICRCVGLEIPAAPGAIVFLPTNPGETQTLSA